MSEGIGQYPDVPAQYKPLLDEHICAIMAHAEVLVMLMQELGGDSLTLENDALTLTVCSNADT